MAIQLSAPEPVELEPVPYPKGFEEKFQRFLGSLTERVSKQYINKTVKKLQVSTVKKFEDAQKGNWANIFVNDLDREAIRDIKRNFPKKRIDKEVARILNSLNQVNQKSFYKNVESAIGIDMNALIKQEGLTPNINALIIETQKWVNKELDDTLAYLGNNALRVMAEGVGYDELLESSIEEAEKRNTKSRFIARNQLSTFNGLSNKIRMQKVGIKQAVWVTAGDERVRPAKGRTSKTNHRDRDGKVFDLDKGCYSSRDRKYLYPGVDYLCRCGSRAIIPTTVE